MKTVIFICIPIIIVIFLFNRGLISKNVFILLLLIIILVGGYFLITHIMDTRSRDNMYYDEYAWNPPDEKKKKSTIPDQRQTDPWGTDCGNNCLSDEIGEFFANSTSGLTNQGLAATGGYPPGVSSTPAVYNSSGSSSSGSGYSSTQAVYNSSSGSNAGSGSTSFSGSNSGGSGSNSGGSGSTSGGSGSTAGSASNAGGSGSNAGSGSTAGSGSFAGLSVPGRILRKEEQDGLIYLIDAEKHPRFNCYKIWYIIDGDRKLDIGLGQEVYFYYDKPNFKPPPVPVPIPPGMDINRIFSVGRYKDEIYGYYINFPTSVFPSGVSRCGISTPTLNKNYLCGMWTPTGYPQLPLNKTAYYS